MKVKKKEQEANDIQELLKNIKKQKEIFINIIIWLLKKKKHLIS